MSAKLTSVDDELPRPLPEIVATLIQFDGCIGVETARSKSGKVCVFTWFQDRAAVVRWFYSEPHKNVIYEYFPDLVLSHPIEHAPPDCPIMVVASFTPEVQCSDTLPEGAKIDSHFPFLQASIEHYAPIYGGVSFGGTFAPSGLVIERPCKASTLASYVLRLICRLIRRVFGYDRNTKKQDSELGVRRVH